jgi:hypothetical protein
MKKYSNIKVMACIDWVEVQIQTVKPTNFTTIRKRLEAPYVVALDDEHKPLPIHKSNSAASVFKLRVHDVKNWQQLSTDLNSLLNTNELADCPKVLGVEVAIDAWSKGATREDLIHQTRDFFRFLSAPRSKNQRMFAGPKVKPTGIPSKPEMLSRIAQGHPMYIGSQSGDGVSYRIYFKQVDKDKPLPQAEHRARIEVTLAGDALPFQSLDEASQRSIASLKQYFSFRQIKTSAYERMPEMGKHFLDEVIKMPGERMKGRIKYFPMTEADIELNQRIYDALRELNRKLNSSS